MTAQIHRRTATKVRNGRVLKKHNWRLDPDDYNVVPQSEIRLVRRRPCEGSRHLVSIAQLRTFVGLLPDWDEVAVGLDAIVLDSADDCAGSYAPGVVLEVRWTEPQARAYQLLHILPHELGHHHDRITTRSRRRSSRGEPYAEAYANRVLEQVFPSYARAFDL